MDEFNICEPFIEAIVLLLTNTKPIYYCLVYRPPTGNLDLFLDKLEYICLELHSRHVCEINLIGNINQDLNNQCDPRLKRYRDSIRRMGFTQCIHEVTYAGGNTLSALDHIATTDPELYQKSGTLPILASDHFLIYCI